MKVVFLCADKDRESALADAFLEGVTKSGDEGEKVFKSRDIDFDLGDAFCMVGVKSLKIFAQVRAAGKHVIYFDKGYFRHRGPNRTWEYWRIAVDDHHPTDYVGRAKHGPDRWDTIAKRRMVRPKDWRDGPHIIYAGSSEKYHNFVRLPDPTTYAQDIIKQIKAITNRLIIYRPKPTWLDAVPVEGASFSGRNDNLWDLLQHAKCLVTNGSNASFDAVLEGVPSIVLGNGIAKPISSHSLKALEEPYRATTEERDQWLWNIAWSMFTEAEMQTGLAWQAVRAQLEGGELDDSAVDVVAGTGMKPSKALLKKHGLWKKAWKKANNKTEKVKPAKVKQAKLRAPKRRKSRKHGDGGR